MKMSHIASNILCVVSLLSIGFQAMATPAGLTYQGRLIKNNLPVESATVTLILKVTSPGVNECLLFEESHNLNMVSSDGIFSVKIGSGTRTVNDKGFTLTQVFSNTGVAISSLTCTGGVTGYTSAPADSRNVYVTFNDGVDTVAFSSPYVIQSVPYAIEAERLTGKSSSDFLQVTGDSTQTKLNDVMVPSAYTELLALINGTTTQYAKTAGGSFSSDVSLNSHKITGLSTPVAATDATNKQYVDGFVGGKSVDTATLAALAVGDSGKVLSWSGTQWTASATLNQNTTGTAANVTGVVATANGGTGGTGTTNAQTGTSYTTVLGDAGNMITMNNASASTLTIPPNSSVAYPLGTTICAQQIGAGTVTLSHGAGVTFMDTCSTPAAPIFAAQYATLCLMQTVIDTWTVVGNCL